jgi:ABC-type sugar transport system ATPase subunit
LSALELKGLTKSFDSTQVIRGVSLQVEQGEFMVFVGPSGCGKSTLLRLVAGLESPSAGDILMDGAPVTAVSAADRGCAMVFQSYALYPHMTVYANMAFGLENIGESRASIQGKVRAAAELLQLSSLLERKPTQLSGGQRQRVAIGRAIVRNPKVFLFDEPLSNLDAELRVSMRAELRELHRRLKSTMIYVTHDQVEAMTLADRIVVLREGRIEQVGTPQALYAQPANTFVAGFIGSPRMNFIPLSACQAWPEMIGSRPQGTTQIGVRPEHFSVVAEGPGLTLTVNSVEYMGAHSLVQGTLADGTPVALMWVDAVGAIEGQALKLQALPEHVHSFDAQGRALAAKESL